MCGIAGIIGTRDDVTRERLSGLARDLAHRGPDDEGIEVMVTVGACDRVIGFVHRRLAIIDRSPAGHQPMHDPATGNWITFNGEIYNYRELRRELAEHGARFHSASDTEVILHAYARWGAQCVERLQGMFAFAVWDTVAQRLVIAVDRVGVKPLFWWMGAHGELCFASELRALCNTGLVARRIDHAAVSSFLAFGSVQAPRTMIDGVRQLLPGHVLTVDVRTSAVRIESYWEPSASTAPSPPGAIAAVLHAAVARHLVSDVPVGLFLSGGVDSSALAVLAHRVSAGDALESFTVTFPESPYAEGAYARAVGERFCRRHHEIVVRDADLETALPASLDAQDQPSIDGTNVYVIAQAVRAAGVKVILSGQGGDEVFGGYPTFRRFPWMRAGQRVMAVLPVIARQGIAYGVRVVAPVHPVASKMAAYLTADSDALACYAVARQLFHPDMRRTLCPDAPRSSDEAIPADAAAWITRGLADLDDHRTVSLLELRGYLANTLLRDSDVMSMAHGLEVRVPYLDHAVIEQAFRAPAAAFTDPVLPKPLLLRVVEAELPLEVYQRPKMGFTFPWELWLRGRLRPMIEETLRAFPAENALGLDVAVVRRLWEQFWASHGGVTWSRPWALHALMSWAQRQGCV